MDVKKIYLTWQDVEDLVAEVIQSMINNDWTPSVVVGLTRGGLVPAMLISHHLKIPMCSLDVSLRDNEGPFGGTTSTWIPEEIENGHRILVVDDINDTGATFGWIRGDWSNTIRYIKEHGDGWPWNHIKFASLVHNEPSSQPSDFYGRLINKDQDPCWLVYPWESWHQNRG